MTIQILHFTESYGGGVATAIQQYIALPGANHALLARRRPEIDATEVPQSSSSFLVETPSELVREWLRWRHTRIDVVHAHSTIAAAIARSLPHPNAVVAYSPHGLAISHERPAVRLLARTVERGLAFRTHAFGAVSNTEKQQIATLTHTSHPIVVVPHSVPAQSTSVPFDGRDRRLVAVGRLSYHKNPESIAELPHLIERQLVKPATCMWIGEGDADRRSMLESNGWQVTGWLGREKAHELVANSLALVHPSRSEAMPFAVVEAMALGTPVVAADLPALRGLPVKQYSGIDDLTGCLSLLLDDADLWARSSEQAQHYVRSEFSLEKQHQALRSLYGAALGEDS